MLVLFICVSGNQPTKGIKDLARLTVLISYMIPINYTPPLETSSLIMIKQKKDFKNISLKDTFLLNPFVRSVLSPLSVDGWRIVSIYEWNGMEHIYQVLTGSFRPDISCQSWLIIDLAMDVWLVECQGEIWADCDCHGIFFTNSGNFSGLASLNGMIN